MKKITLIISAIFLLAACENSDIKFTYSDENYDSITSGSGTGGSLARFTIVGNYLYTVDGQSLKTFDISSESKIEFTNHLTLDRSNDIETIFAYQNKLFLGSNTGMHILNIDIPSKPQYISNYEHIVSCDPVVVQDQYAYITLHSDPNGRCNRNVNELQVIDLSDIMLPEKLRSYPMNNPLGLGIDNDLLFVCDNGLKVFQRNSPTELLQIHHFTNLGRCYDVIPYKGMLILISSKGVHQYSYENGQIFKLSSLYTIN